MHFNRSLFQMSDMSCLISKDDSDVYFGKDKGWLKMKLFFMLRREVDVDNY